MKPHQGSRLPVHGRASPSDTSALPSERPCRISTRSLRPYRSSSRRFQATILNGPAFTNSMSRIVARSASVFSSAHRGRLTSGVSISAIRMVMPCTLSVSPSMTQFLRVSCPHREYDGVSVSAEKQPIRMAPQRPARTAAAIRISTTSSYAAAASQQAAATRRGCMPSANLSLSQAASICAISFATLLESAHMRFSSMPSASS